MEDLFEKMEASSSLLLDQMEAIQNMLAGFSKYNMDFLIPYLISTAYFSQAELSKLKQNSPVEQWGAYMELLNFNIDLCGKYFSGSVRAIDEFINKEIENYCIALNNSMGKGEGENLNDFFLRQFDMLKGVNQKLPKAVQEIEPEYGFHFERQENPLFAETERFLLYQIEPVDPSVKVDEKGKPVIIIPPFVLGSNILGFLPKENKSYAHCFANQGVPTYIRIMKDIHTTQAFQVMTLEDDALDTRYFCEKVMERHDKKVTLNGYCQGGYTAVCNVLSGQLDHVVDALITCVSPMDGTRSKGIGHFLEKLPARFKNLLYGTKTLLNGNKVVDGLLMGWVYKLKSIEDEAPVVVFLRDMFLVSQMDRHSDSISKTAAALNYWLRNERVDIPVSVTEMSFASYNIPVTKDGTLPVKMFGKTLNFNAIQKKKIPWLLCYGENDDLVEKETALAPQDYIEIEAVPFPKGHVAIATSWSNPESPYALHTRFGPDNRYRGPVRFQLDLNEALDQLESVKAPVTASKKTPAKKKAAPVKKKTEKKAGPTAKSRAKKSTPKKKL